MKILFLLQKLTKTVMTLGKDEVALAILEGIDEETIRKIAEIATMNTSVKYRIYTNTNTRKEMKSEQKKKVEDKGVIIVNAGRKKYSHILKKVKEEVTKEKNIIVQRVRETKDGGVLIEVKGEKTANKVKDILDKKQDINMKVVAKSGIRTKTVHVFGMDGVTPETEIILGVQEQIQINIIVRSIRPTVRKGKCYS